MADKQVMINPSRPMIMYQSMEINLQRLDVDSLTLQLAKTELTIEGKRGDAWLEFDLLSEGEVVGHGRKHMLLSGIREYEQESIDAMVALYRQSKADYQK